MEAYTKKLDQSFVMREPAIRSAIRTLQFAPNSHGLDIGCGIGNITGLLAESIAPRGRVTGVDISPSEVAEIAFDLLPISVRFEAGWQLRLAIAGSDKDVFAPIPGCEAPEITVERNSQYASYIDLPIIPG